MLRMSVIYPIKIVVPSYGETSCGLLFQKSKNIAMSMARLEWKHA